MGSYKINFKPSVEKDLRPLSKTLIARIMERIEKLKTVPLPRQAVKLSVPSVYIVFVLVNIGLYMKLILKSNKSRSIIFVIAERYIAYCER